jgi:sphinganine-1-phosphate aldolase
LLLHADAALRRPQFFAHADWPGYTMLNSTMQSTKSGGPLAAAWAVVRLIGADGYRALVERTLAGTRALAEGIEQIEHLHLVERPDTSLVVAGTDDAVDVFTLSDLMLDRGWFVQPQMRFGDEPANLHLTISAATVDSVPGFLAALREAVVEASAVARLGAHRDGVLRKHKQRDDGSWRDTVTFSMLDDEWPAAKARLRAALAR